MELNKFYLQNKTNNRLKVKSRERLHPIFLHWSYIILICASRNLSTSEYQHSFQNKNRRTALWNTIWISVRYKMIQLIELLKIIIQRTLTVNWTGGGGLMHVSLLRKNFPELTVRNISVNTPIDKENILLTGNLY